MIEIAISVVVILLLTAVSVLLATGNTVMVLATGGGLMILLTAGYMSDDKEKLIKALQLFLAFVFAFSTCSWIGCIAFAVLLWTGALNACLYAAVTFIIIQAFRYATGIDDISSSYGNAAGYIIASGIVRIVLLEIICIFFILIRNKIRKSSLSEKENRERLRAYSLSEMHQMMKNRELALNNFYSDKNARLLERENISRNIHNSVGHSITAAIMTLDAADVLFDKDPEEAHRRMNDAGTRIRGSLSAIRSAVRALDEESSDVTVKDLICFFDNILDEFLMDTERKCERIYDIISDEYMIPREHAEYLTGALSEFLTNGVKHGKASFFIVEFSGDKAHIRLSVTDNGESGFNEENSLRRISEGFGLKKLTSYAERCGGSTEFWNDDGFHSVIELPLLQNG